MRIGIDLGGSHIAVGIIGEEGKILIKKEMDIQEEWRTQDIKKILEDKMIEFINELLKQAGAPTCAISKIGIAVPGSVKEGKIKSLVNLHIENWELAEKMQSYFKIPVNIRNDGKCAGLAEKKWGSLQEYKDCVFMCLGTGIGGAIFYQGKLVEPICNEGAEFGHMIIEENGRECNCGNKGCFEKYASMKVFKQGVLKLLKLPEDYPAKELLKILAIEKNKPEIEEYIEAYIGKLYLGISNIVRILEPEVISIGGSFVYFEEILYERLIEKLEKNINHIRVPKVVLASLGNDAGMMGA